jgi:hypothetical protein
MNPRSSFAWLFLCVVCAAQAQPIAVPALGPRYKQTRERIDALFQYRNGTYALPDTAQNPFRTGEIAQTTPTPDTAKRDPVPPDSDDAILRKAIASIQLARMEVGGVSILVANRKQYKAGDSISIRFRDHTVNILVKDISPIGVTLSYNTVESFQSFAAQKQ